jgi:acyl carrier protein
MSVTREEIEQEVVRSVEAFGLSDEPVTMATSVEDLALDLPDLVELSNLARQRWHLELSPDELDPAETVNDVVEIICARGVTG